MNAFMAQTREHSLMSAIPSLLILTTFRLDKECFNKLQIEPVVERNKTKADDFSGEIEQEVMMA